MQASQKTKRDRYIVIGLVGVFALTASRAISSMGLSRRKPAVPAPMVETNVLSEPIAGKIKARLESLDSNFRQGEVAPPPAAAAPASAYTAQELRDPMKSLLPAPPAPDVADAGETVGALVETPEPALPPVALQGLWWGVPQPKAIIDGKLYRVGDELHGGKITAITRDGVLVELGGQRFQLSTVAPADAGGETMSQISAGR